MTESTRRVTPWSAAALALAVALPRPAGAAAPPPATQPTRPVAAISTDLRANGIALGQALAGGSLTDPAKRSAAAPTLVPLVRREQSLLDEMAAARHLPSSSVSLATQRQTNESLLYLLGDKTTVDRVNAAAGSTPTAAAALPARGVQLHARWLAAGRDPAAEQAVAADLEQLDAAHPDDAGLTRLTFALSQTAATPALQSRLLSVAAQTMRNPTADQYKVLLAQQNASVGAEQKQKAIEGQPITVSGTTVDGKPFTSADYRGKVVLVDFWATWCGPCKAELPRIKDAYAKYHAKGLEIVGVSNDFSADPLKSYLAQNDMPWVELFDPAAAAEHRPNSATTAYGIETIPVLFLIDKTGVLRTVEGRSKMDALIPALLAE